MSAFHHGAELHHLPKSRVWMGARPCCLHPVLLYGLWFLLHIRSFEDECRRGGTADRRGVRWERTADICIGGNYMQQPPSHREETVSKIPKGATTSDTKLVKDYAYYQGRVALNRLPIV